eukprot:COSAG02_NODE_35433_length_468_cov_1.113821_1_plen_122_part_01
MLRCLRAQLWPAAIQSVDRDARHRSTGRPLRRPVGALSTVPAVHTRRCALSHNVLWVHPDNHVYVSIAQECKSSLAVPVVPGSAKVRDDCDTRSAALLNLLTVIANMDSPPRYWLMENVAGF